MKPFSPDLRRLFLLFPVFFVVFTQQAIAQQSERPFTGLTLSGGGAKGIAHIGVLKAISGRTRNRLYHWNEHGQRYGRIVCYWIFRQ
jgi:hypothetical protein